MLSNIQDEHFDGEREGVYNDSIGKEIGVQSDATKESANPFHVKALKKDTELKRYDRTQK
ncbi:hypothetical protein [Sediminibacillus halophilus]|uniref:Uncharacterized protein n=1 Tax=Sediminibacillus halophilus TaxID=482461 RepID=A0A1G9NFJ5_9BACI|nr:hypothetical protein [Sediminibacillus halophilus]SDL85250.1 hypothetical protein SAMN05216244_0979 [Sediminibacillus halophilus]